VVGRLLAPLEKAERAVGVARGLAEDAQEVLGRDVVRAGVGEEPAAFVSKRWRASTIRGSASNASETT
jgi:hypothetical protein